MIKENLEITVLLIIIGTSLLLPIEILRDRISNKIKNNRLAKTELKPE